MFGLFKKKVKEATLPINSYQMQFKVVYHLTDGNERSTGIVNVSVPAVSEEQAKEKLEKFAVKRIEIRVVRCEK